MTTNTDHCPHCGAERTESKFYIFTCGSSLVFPEKKTVQSDLCREREAHNKTREAWEGSKKDTMRALELADEWAAKYCASEAENARLRSIAEIAIDAVFHKSTEDILRAELEQITKS